LVLLGKPQPPAATPGERASVLSRLLPNVAGQIGALEHELEAGLFTEEPADLGRARTAAAAILLQAVRERLRRLVHMVDANDESSGAPR